ncbi:MAG TPA: substrate-binding domain-containing protein, partial [Limnochordia bacterium]|nr:substrate-binding domain-containing protein [Limnochordia bacterium]
PVVQILYRTPLKGASAVLVDQEQGGYLAARHVLELGHRRIACLWVDDPHGRQRLAGFRRALAEAGLAADPSLVVPVDYDWHLGRSATESLLARAVRPTAIVAASDLVAWGAIRAAKEAGLGVPGDLSVVGFDDMPLAGYVEVPLTTVRQPTEALGRQALSLLRERINGNDVEDRVLAPELVVRGSTGPVG